MPFFLKMLVKGRGSSIRPFASYLRRTLIRTSECEIPEKPLENLQTCHIKIRTLCATPYSLVYIGKVILKMPMKGLGSSTRPYTSYSTKWSYH